MNIEASRQKTNSSESSVISTTNNPQPPALKSQKKECTMNTRTFIFSAFTFVCSLFAFIAMQAGAASITHIASPDVGGSEINVSVFDGKAAYEGNGASGQFGDGTATDYRLFRDDESDAVETFATKGTRISDINKTGTYSFSRRDYLDFWTGDPGPVTGGIPDFSTLADYDFSIDGEHTSIGHDGVSGTINISGLYSGSVYFIYGTYNDGYTLELTMSGAGQGDLDGSVDVNGGGALQNQVVIDGYWISEFSFDNASGAYDTITFDLSGTNGFFSGVVMNGEVPEPSTILLAGLGLAGLCLRRRRRK